MKVDSYHECDICGCRMDDYVIRFRIRRPKVKFGYPELGMKRYDVCDECFAELSVLIEEKLRKKENSNDP